VTQLSIGECGPDRNESLSQFYTPPRIAQRMVQSVGDVRLFRVLEPSCGLGALLKPLAERGSGRIASDVLSFGPMVVDAVDIDARNIEWCKANVASNDDADLRYECGDYLKRPQPMEAFYDLGLVNPPYENGQDGEFLAKMMRECIRIVALIRTESLHGVARYEQVWRHCDGPESPWVVRTVETLVRRANFGGGGGMIETSIVKLSRRQEHENGSVQSCVGWCL